MLQCLEHHPHVRAIEIKLSQGAQPGVGGILPSVKVTPEIAAIRAIAVGEDCISPAAHSAFRDADSLLDFVERLAEATGLPVGIKSAVGEHHFWQNLARLTATTGRGVDFITVDGGEGGTGAGPLVFMDHMALPFKLAFARVYRIFAERGLQDKVVFIGSGKLGLPETALFAFALGADLINVAREPMLALGCIQAKKCHTGGCPTGITTHNRWLTRGLDVQLKSARTANYIITLRKELCRLSRACGVPHPALVNAEHFEILGDGFDSTDIYRLFGYTAGMGLPSTRDRELITEIMLRYAETMPGWPKGGTALC
jgi:glutamate synthase domain-containing protein 2